jgi:phage terminase large subunit
MTAPAQLQPFLEFLDRYADHSELFVREVLNFPNEHERAQGKDVYPWQRDVLAAVDRGEPWIAIRSGHGVGKTTVLAWLLWHRILCRFPQKTGVTAPSEKQLFDALWAEFQTWGNRLPKTLQGLVEVKAASAELRAAPSESFISIKTARAEQPGALQGLHSEWELVVIDEASDVPETVWQAAQSSLTGPHPMAILTGNPLIPEGFFYRAHSTLKGMWWTRHVPRAEVKPDLEHDSYAQGIIAEWGQNSNAYRVRVEGEFPISEDDVIITYDLVEPALTRDVQVPRLAPVIWGVDCARFGSNRSALAKRQTQQLLEPIRWWTKLDAMELAARINMEWDATPDFLRPLQICVDAIGEGGGVVDRLKQLGLPARGVNVQETPALQNLDRYADLRTELWFKARTWFANRDCKIPQSYAKRQAGDDFVKELTSEHYDFRDRKGRVHAKAKDQAHSPDLADAFVLTFAVDAISLARGRERGHRSFKPVLNPGLV